MYTLGINAAFHDSSACLVEDGQVVAAVEEERFTRIKHGKRPVPFSTWELPFHAIDYCLAEAGIEGRTLIPEQQAKRDAVKACVHAARAQNPDDKTAARAAARACLEQAGVTPGRIRAKLAGARECLQEVRTANPDADRAELRRLVKECVAAR